MESKLKERFEVILASHLKVYVTKNQTNQVLDAMHEAYQLDRAGWISVEQGIPYDEFWYQVLVDGKHHILPFCVYDGKWYEYAESKQTALNITHYRSFTDLPNPPQS